MTTFYQNSTLNMWEKASSSKNEEKNSKKRIIQEIMHDSAPTHDFRKQNDLHEIIRNEEDYDDWEYGTEPNYGKTW